MNPLMQSIGSAEGSVPGNFSQIAGIVRMLKSGNPEQIAQNLMLKNPQFKAFLDSNHGKTPDQVAKEHGFDFKKIMEMIK